MTTGDWLGLVCLAGLVGFFAGGFFVWNLFYKHPPPDDEPEEQEAEPSEEEPLSSSPPRDQEG